MLYFTLLCLLASWRERGWKKCNTYCIVLYCIENGGLLLLGSPGAQKKRKKNGGGLGLLLFLTKRALFGSPVLRAERASAGEGYDRHGYGKNRRNRGGKRWDGGYERSNEKKKMKKKGKSRTK